VYNYACMCIPTHTCGYMRKHVYNYAYMCIPTYACIYLRIHVYNYTYMSIPTYACVYFHIHVHTYTYRSHMYTCTYVTRSCLADPTTEKRGKEKRRKKESKVCKAGMD
jgi:hypothetical protein